MIELKKNKTIQEVYKVTKGVKKYSKNMYEDLIRNFIDMSQGGEGGLYMAGYNWTTVRSYHYSDWTDSMFEKLLELLGESGKINDAKFKFDC